VVHLLVRAIDGRAGETGAVARSGDRRDIRAANYFARYALAIGLGFAIREMWFVADRIARVPEFSVVPWYQFGGYVGERLMTCGLHSAFVAVGLWQLRRRFALGVAGAIRCIGSAIFRSSC
jgi:hypothetical protein